MPARLLTALLLVTPGIGRAEPELQLEGLEAEGLPSSGPVSRTSIIERTTIGGYGEHELIAGEGELSRFRNHRFVVFVYSQIAPRISTASEIEFEWAGSPKKRDGTLRSGEVLLEFSVVDFEVARWLVLRAGVILVPVGVFNQRHDAATRDLVARPTAYTTVVPTTWFESGVGLHGEVTLGGAGRLGYELYVINGLDASIYDGLGLRAARGSHFEDNNQDKALTGRLGWSPVLGLELGASGYSGAYDLGGGRVGLGNLDLALTLGRVELLGELARVWIDPGFVQGFSASSPANTRDPVPEGMWGFYGQLNVHLMVPALRRLLPQDLRQATFTAVARYGGRDTDLDRLSAAGDRRRLTLGLNFRPIEALVFKTDYQLEAAGIDDRRPPAEAWQGAFWRGERRGRFRFLTSVAYLF